MIHLEAFRETWEMRLHLFLKEVSEARITYPWLNYYTMNETLILEELLDKNSDDTTILRHLQFAHPHLAESELPKYVSSWNILKGTVLERVGGFLHRIFGDIGEEFFRKPLMEEKIGRVSECEDGKPNLFFAKTDAGLQLLMGLYLNRKQVPMANQVLVCDSTTTAVTS